jgi:N-acetylglucosaminyldiphosphoundecaprenol N-acetyl-beta-D-mannosaminyltransferase
MGDRFQVGDVWFDVAPFHECVDAIVGWALAHESHHVHFGNAYTIALADADPAYADVLNAGTTYTDGMPVAWVGRRAYAVPPGQWTRVYGPDVMAAVLGRPEPLRHYLLGGSLSTLDALRATISSQWPGARIVGGESPPFRPLTNEEQQAQDHRIKQSGADMVWVGLGTPKQDFEAARLAESTGIVALAVGAAFDFLSGTKPQAPVWMQRTGTEWAYRLSREPRRLGRRYIWGNPRFLLAAARNPGLRRGE